MDFFKRILLVTLSAPLDKTTRQGNTDDPMKIIGHEAINPASDIEPVDYLWTDGLYYGLSEFLTIMSVVVIIASLITMLFVSKSEKLAEKKQDILHKLLIVFIASSLIAVLNFAVDFMRYLFNVTY